MNRVERIRASIGDVNALDFDRDEHVRDVLRMLDYDSRRPCDRCGVEGDPLAEFCAACGEPTFSDYLIPDEPAKRAAGVPLEPETPQTAMFP